MEIGSILCPVELTLNSEKALRYAAGLARAYEAKLYVLTCTEALAPAGTPPRLEAGAEVRQTMERSLRQYVDDADLGGIAWESLLVEGSNPAEAIPNDARTDHTEFILLSTHG